MAERLAAEWYFRSGLDRYIWIHGMLVAWAHPVIEGAWAYIENLATLPRVAMRGAVLVVAAVAGHVWYQRVFTLDKLSYNALHPFTSWVPITLWIVIRNLTPGLRSHSLAFFGWLGCITLETYLSQFHIWLRTNIPDGQPKWTLDLVRAAASPSRGSCLLILAHLGSRSALFINVGLVQPTVGPCAHTGD
jgi:N-acetylneuraminate 9-O-acetyltransferase